MIPADQSERTAITAKRGRFEIAYGTFRVEIDFRRCTVSVSADDPDLVTIRDLDGDAPKRKPS